MKALLRSDAVIGAAAALVSAYLRLAYATTRWTHVDREKAQALFDGGPVILCLWHRLVPIAPVVWPREHRGRLRILISQSADGELIARTMAGIGLGAIRGSSQKRTDPAKTKGGMAAFREMAKWVKTGGSIAITPDGPRGPSMEMADGAPVLARFTKAPVVMVGVASRPCFRLNTWDRTVFPVPFAKGVVVWDGPFLADEDEDNARLAGAWGERLSAALARAESLADGL
ncbi:MAG TPA: lysophospholipid acyltransferase family protein [Caulobacteraceae bacterium]|nr:lysophospholipid acyltransferase family protein [Caulobacteraceae bacterium]